MLPDPGDCSASPFYLHKVVTFGAGGGSVRGWWIVTKRIGV